MEYIVEVGSGLSLSRLRSIFRQETGMCLGEYITQIRLEYGKRLLAETDLKCYSVGLEIGIRDETHFTRWFKRLEGITPAEFRSKTQAASKLLERKRCNPLTDKPHVEQIGNE